jgi:hypothetical protein
MAEQSITHQPLSEEKLAAGRECLRLLDEYELGVQGAVWIYLDILKEWRFYIVTSLIDIDGLVETYNRIEKLFGLRFNNTELSIDDIHLGSPNEAMFLMLASVFKIQGDSLVELKNMAVNDLVIDHAYVYRLDRAPPIIEAKQARQKFDRKVKELERAAGG